MTKKMWKERALEAEDTLVLTYELLAQAYEDLIETEQALVAQEELVADLLYLLDDADVA